jgi:hypothetical protein
MAQNIVVVGPGGTGVLTSNNTATVNATFSVPGAVSLTNGVQNTQGALGTGASAFANISQTISDSPPGGINLTTVPTNSVSATGGGGVTPTLSAVNTATGTVEASIGIPGAVTITNGVADSIIAQGTGSAATASISSVVDNVATLTTGASPSSNTVAVTAGLSSTNSALVTANQQVPGFVPFASATINAGAPGTGVGNTIAISATGASAGLGITQSGSNSQAANDLATLPTNKVTATFVAALNNLGANVLAEFNVTGQSLITGGVENSIVGQAIGASASDSISSHFYNLATQQPVQGVSTNVIASTDVSAINAGTVTVQGNLGPGATMGSTNIQDGVANLIGASGVGASAGATINQVVSNTGSFDLSSLPSNTIGTSGVPIGNIGALNFGAVTTELDVSGASLINNGVANAVSSQSIGSAANASISSLFNSIATQAGLGTTLNTINAGTVTSVNSATVKATLNTGSAEIDNGVANSIAASSVGASATASINQVVYASTGFDVTAMPPNSIKVGAITSDNSGTVNATVNAGTALIENGVGNSIVASAAGASAGAGITQSASASTMNLTGLSSNTVTSGSIFAGGLNNGSNTGPVTASLTVPGTSTQILDGVANSIAAQATGAAASASISSRFYDVTTTAVGPTAALNHVTVSGDITSKNAATIQALASIGNVFNNTTVSINGSGTQGVGNLIGASAVGASSVASINQTVSWNGGGGTTSLTSLPANTVSVNTTGTGISSANTGAISASFTQLGGTGSITSINGGVGNSISAQAVGSLSGASITQVVHNAH